MGQVPKAAAGLHHDVFAKDGQKRLARRLGLEVARDSASGATLDAAFDHIDALGRSPAPGTGRRRTSASTTTTTP